MQTKTHTSYKSWFSDGEEEAMSGDCLVAPSGIQWVKGRGAVRDGAVYWPGCLTLNVRSAWLCLSAVLLLEKSLCI